MLTPDGIYLHDNFELLITDIMHKHGIEEPKRSSIPSRPVPSIRFRLRSKAYSLLNNSALRAELIVLLATFIWALYWIYFRSMSTPAALLSGANTMLQGLITFLTILIAMGIFGLSRLAETEAELRKIRYQYEVIIYESNNNWHDSTIYKMRSELKEIIKAQTHLRSWHPYWEMLLFYLHLWVLEYHWFANVQTNFMTNNIFEDLREVDFDDRQCLNAYTSILNKHLTMKNDPVKFLTFLREVLTFFHIDLSREAVNILPQLPLTIKTLNKIDERFHIDNISDCIANNEKYRLWSGGNFRTVSAIVFVLMIVEVLLLPLLENSSWAFPLFFLSFLYAVSALVFYAFSLFYPIKMS